MDESKNKVFCSADYCRQIKDENTELRSFMRMALKDMNDGRCTRCHTCANCEPSGDCSNTSKRYEWRYTEQVEKELAVMDEKEPVMYTKMCMHMKDLILSKDPERAHGEADDILCEFLRYIGCGALVDLYEKVSKYYA